MVQSTKQKKQPPLTRWFPDKGALRKAGPQRQPRPQYALSMLDDGTALAPWARRGYETLHAPLSTESARAAELVERHAGNIAIALAFPACVDLCASGARWWKRKRAKP